MNKPEEKITPPNPKGFRWQGTPRLKRISLLIIATTLLLPASLCSGSATYFNRTASSESSQSQRVVKTLDLKGDETILDLGSGGGHFSYLFAEAVKEKGRVIAADVNEEMQAFIRQEIKKRGIKNLTTQKISGKFYQPPEQSVRFDLIFLRNVYHHLPDQVEYFSRIRDYLKPTGRIVILENKKTASTFIGSFGHYTSPAKIKGDLEKAGLVREKEYSFLDKQSFQVFVLPTG